MGNLVFQATLGGQVNLVGPNTASTFNLNVPAVAGTLVTTGDTGTVTSTMLATSVYTAPGTIGSGTANTGAFTTLTTSSTVTVNGGTANGVGYLNGSKVLTTGSALVFDGENLGVGIASPTARLHIQSATTGSVIVGKWTDGATDTGYLTTVAGTGCGIGAGGTLSFGAGGGASFTEQMRLTSTGLGIGTTSPSTLLQVTTASSGANVFSITGGSSQVVNMGVSSAGGGPFLYVTSNHALRFGTNDTERARIDSSGNLLVGTTSLVYGFAGNIQTYAAQYNYLAAGPAGSVTCYAMRMVNNSAGTVVGSITYTSTGTLYNVTSDQRLKENIVDAPEFGSVIDSIKVRSYDWKANGSHQRAGFIAQELVTVAPEAVNQPVDTEEMMAVDYSKLVPMLVKEIQSLRQRLAAANL